MTFDFPSFLLGMAVLYGCIEAFGVPSLAHWLGRRARAGGR